MITRPCKGKNEFLKDQIYKAAADLQEVTAFTDTSVCKGLWSQKGTCCTYSEALKASVKQAKDIHARALAFEKTIYNIKTMIEKAASLHSRDFPELAFMRKVDSRSSRGDASKCWSHMATARSASFCFVCSGDSKRYFAEDKALVTLKDCGAILNNCKNFLSSSHNIISGFSDFIHSKAESLRSGETTEDKVTLTDLTKWVDSMKKTLKDSNFSIDLKTYFSDDSNSSQKTQAAGKLCSKTVKLGKNPILKEMLSLVKLVESRLKRYLEPYLKPIKPVKPSSARVLLLSSNWDSRTGSQNNNGQPEIILEPITVADLTNADSLFGGDVKVVTPNDNMFTSFVGNDGAHHSHHKPMNLSLQFA